MIPWIEVRPQTFIALAMVHFTQPGSATVWGLDWSCWEVTGEDVRRLREQITAGAYRPGVSDPLTETEELAAAELPAGWPTPLTVPVDLRTEAMGVGELPCY